MANLKWYGSQEIRWFGFIGIRYTKWSKSRVWKRLNTIHLREGVRRIYRGITRSTFKGVYNENSVYQDFLAIVVTRL